MHVAIGVLLVVAVAPSEGAGRSCGAGRPGFRGRRRRCRGPGPAACRGAWWGWGRLQSPVELNTTKRKHK